LFKNEYLLDVDLKFIYSSRTPVFRRGDTSILKLRVHDNSVIYNLDNMSEAEMTIIMPSGLTLRSLCKFEDTDTGKIVVFVFEAIHMIEVGIYNLILTITDGNGQVSVQPFKVRFFDSLNDSDTTIFELIQDLQNKINELERNVTDTVKQSEKGAPNGVATLNSDSKLTESQIPLSIERHLKQTVYLTGAHKWRINNEGMGQYETPDGKYQYVGMPTYSATDVQRLILDTIASESIVSLHFTGEGSPSDIKRQFGNKNISYFMTDGISVVNNSFKVDRTGMFTIFYKDEQGNEYLKKIVVDKGQIKPPDVEIYIEEGVVSFLSDTEFQIRKIAEGTHQLEYFHTNGIPLPSNSIKVTTAGYYTAYYQTMTGLDYIQNFVVLPTDFE